jgi:hypothetical protein
MRVTGISFAAASARRSVSASEQERHVSGLVFRALRKRNGSDPLVPRRARLLLDCLPAGLPLASRALLAFSRRLRSLIAETGRDGSRLALEFVLRSDLVRTFPAYLAMTFYVARASVPLLRAAARRSRRLEFSTELGAYFVAHEREERHHARWILDDLAALGRSRAKISAGLPPLAVARGVGAQYYLIEHQHPLALLGYMLVLEGGLPSAAIVENMIARSGLPRNGFRTLLRHALEDPGHTTDLERLVDGLALDASQRALLALSATATLQMLNEVFEDVLRAGATRPALVRRRAAKQLVPDRSRLGNRPAKGILSWS